MPRPPSVGWTDRFDRRRVALGLGVVVLAVAGLGLAAGVPSFAPRASVFADGEGALGTGGAVGDSVSYGVDPRRTDATSWTFGIPLCVHGSEPVILRSVDAAATVGSEFRFLGARLRRFTPTPTHEAMGSVAGFPPPTTVVPDVLSAVAGFVVGDHCPPLSGGRYTEPLLGFGAAGPGGGGWRGVAVTYEQSGGDRTVTIPWTMAICGTDARFACHDEPTASPPPSSAMGAPAATRVL